MTDPTDEVVSPDEVEDATKVAGIFRFLAEVEFPGYSPLYEHLATHIAEELWIPALVTRHSRSPFAPILFFACVREVALVHPDEPLAAHFDRAVRGEDALDPDPWPTFRTLVADRRDEIGVLLESRSVQTNEVGRSAALLPAFTVVARRFDRPLALIEVGCSAGLNLFFDRYRIDYGRAGSVGPPDSPVRLTSEVRGDLMPPIPAEPPPVRSRLGLDLHPIDVTDAAATRWLEACVWPDVPHRVERLRAAIGLARAEPPELWAGNAVDLVADAVRSVPDDTVACLDSTWVLAYFSDDERARLHAVLDDLGRTRILAYVTAEDVDKGGPWLPAPPTPTAAVEHKVPTLVSLGVWDHGRTEHRALAWMPPHGQWLDWLDPTTGSPSGSATR